MPNSKAIAKARKPYIQAMDILDCLKRVDRIPWVSIAAHRYDEETHLTVTYKEDPSNTYGVVAPRLFREPAPPPEATEPTEGKDLKEIMEGDYGRLVKHLQVANPKVYDEFMGRDRKSVV